MVREFKIQGTLPRLRLQERKITFETIYVFVNLVNGGSAEKGKNGKS